MQFGKVLIAVDTSAAAARAAKVGVELAGALKAQLAFVHVVDPASTTLGTEGAIPADDLLRLLEQDGNALLSRFAVQSGLEPEPLQLLRTGAPATEVVHAAEEWAADMIVMGTHGVGRMAQLLMGSVAQGVLRHASCPVVVVRSKE